MKWYLLMTVLVASARAFLPLAEDSAECDLDCDDSDSVMPVCGNDGRTYESRCDIERAKCQGHPVELKHNGKCLDRARCEAQRRLMLAQGAKAGMFVPECKADGSYAEVQCHLSTGYCWCVDEAGKPVRGSSIQNARPNCAGKGRRNNRRRSSRGRKNRKGCSSNDRASFNANLIDIFQSEYNRVPHSTGTVSPGDDPLRDTHEKQVIQWKFDELDDNGDTYLKRKEIRDLRRMAKKIVKPKSCAKTFAKFCDLDQDKKISRSEWSVCVGVDINNEQVNGVDDFLDDAPKAPEEELIRPVSTEEPWDSEKHVHQLRPDGTQASLDKDAEETSKEEVEPQDCASARRTALDNHRANPSAGIYVPECTPEGAYARAQCHKSPQYCWCVQPRTGRPIKGTATQGVRPDCDGARRGLKNFKGCSLHKKQEFLDELVQSFIREMMEDARNKSIVIDTPTSEKGARWKFASIDINSNSVLDKREWKVFKKEWRSFQQRGDGRQKKQRLRKCWRNLPRFCDENDDQKITMDEWLACTSVTRDTKTSLPRNQNRRGKNPFSTILKSD